jgi:hypothetical protein
MTLGCVNESNVKREPHNLDHEFWLRKIEGEHRLIDNRMSWMMTSQAFLLAAFGFINGPLSSSPNCNSSNNIKLTILSVGILSTVLFSCSIYAAFFAIRRWRAESENKHALISEFYIHYFGDAPAAVLGPLIITLWISIGTVNPEIFSWISVRPISWILTAFIAALLIWHFVVRFIFFETDKKQPNPTQNPAIRYHSFSETTTPFPPNPTAKTQH